MPDNQLSSLLSSLKLSAPDVTEIAALAKTSNYQIACQRHFDVTHPGHLNNPELKVENECECACVNVFFAIVALHFDV